MVMPIKTLLVASGCAQGEAAGEGEEIKNEK
jgi:hypothetical protein